MVEYFSLDPAFLDGAQRWLAQEPDFPYYQPESNPEIQDQLNKKQKQKQRQRQKQKQQQKQKQKQKQNLQSSEYFEQPNQPVIQPIDVSQTVNNNSRHPAFFGNDFLNSLNNLSPGNVNGAKDVGVSDAMAAFGFNAIIFVILIGIYELLNRLIPSIYAARILYAPDDQMIIDLPRRSILPLSWLPTVLRTNWTSVRKCGGLDAYFFLRYIKMCMRITLVSGLWGMILLWPVFASGGNISEGWYYFSMANVTQGSWRTWFPTIFMWFLTFYILFAMKEEYKHYLELRMQYLAEGDVNMNPQTQHSLMIEEIPREIRNDKALYTYFDALFPGKVHSAYVVLNIPDLERIASKRRRAVRRLEKSIAYYEATSKRLTHVVGRKRLMCCGIETYPIRNFGGKVFVEQDDYSSTQKGERVDSISYYTVQLVELNESVEKLQREKKTLAAEGSNSIDSTLWISRMIEIASDAATAVYSFLFHLIAKKFFHR